MYISMAHFDQLRRSWTAADTRMQAASQKADLSYIRLLHSWRLLGREYARGAIVYIWHPAHVHPVLLGGNHNECAVSR